MTMTANATLTKMFEVWSGGGKFWAPGGPGGGGALSWPPNAMAAKIHPTIVPAKSDNWININRNVME
jgi:hypothetical protein